MDRGRVAGSGAVLRLVLRQTYRKKRVAFFLLVTAAVGAALLELAPPLLLRRIIDGYLLAGRGEGLWTAAGYYLLALLGSSTAGFTLALLTAWIGQNILLELRLVLARHLTRLPLGYYNRTPVGEIMSRLTADVDAVNTLFSAGLISAMTDLLKITGIALAMYMVSPPLFLMAIAAIPLIFGFANYFRRNLFRAQLRIRRAVGAINSYLQETFSGVRLIKAYGKEALAVDRFQPALAEHLRANNYAAVFDAYFPCVMQVLKALTVAAVVWTGARTGYADRIAISLGSLAAMADLTGRMLSPVEALSQEVQAIQQAMAGLKRITEFLGEEPEDRQPAIGAEPEPASESTGTVTVSGVGFGYSPGKPVLQEISFRVEPGQKVACVGRTGAGKTTLLSLLAGLYRPAAGIIRVAGTDPFTIVPAQRRRLIGVVPQNVIVLEGTVGENISLRDESITAGDIEAAARTVGLHAFITGLPRGYDSVLGEGGTRLSYGQSQLLALARAIVADPPLLLLDEPTSGLDTLTEAAVFAAFQAAGQQRTIITISHRLSGVIDADMVFIMANGRIVQSGPPAELAREQGWYSVFKQLEDLGWKVEDQAG